MAVDAEQVLAHLRKLQAARQGEAEKRARRLRERVPEARRILHGFGARRVILFGSLAEGRPSPASDVDLAVEGLPAAAYFDALAELMALFGVPVDLVRIELATESLKHRLYEQGQQV